MSAYDHYYWINPRRASTPTNKKAGGRYAADHLFQLPALLVRLRRISEQSLDRIWLIKA